MHPSVYSSTIYNSQYMKAIYMSIDRWMDKEDMVYISDYSAIKKNEIMPFAITWMDLEIIILNEVSQTDKDKYKILLICKILKMVQINLFTKQK